MRKKAFTLIELLVVMSIITIFSTVTFTSYKYISKFKDNEELEYSTNICIDFILKSKNYCKNNNKNGYILYVRNKNSLYFSSDIKDGEYMPLPENVTIDETPFITKGVKINEDGVIGSAGSINLKNKSNKRKRVIISVYTNYIREE